MGDVLKITGLHNQAPKANVDVNVFYHFRILGVQHEAPHVRKDFANKFGQGVQAEISSEEGVVKFRLIALDGEGGSPIPAKNPVWDKHHLPDASYMDGEQFDDASRRLKNVLVYAGVEIDADDEFVIADLEGAEVELRTYGYSIGDDERIGVNWPDFK